MSRHGEITLIQHLTDRDSVATLVSEGLALECIPSEDLRRVVTFACDYFYSSGRSKAPSEAVITSEFGDMLNDHEITLDDPDDSIEWAIDDLKGSYVHLQVASLNKRFAASMAEADTGDKLDVLNVYSTEFISLANKLENRQTRVDVREALPERMLAYESRSQDKEMVYGMRFGLPIIDSYTRGIHPGELAILAAGPKTGKSFFMDLVALKEWQSGRKVALFTLENSVEMTLDRIAGLATGVSQRGFLHGDLPPEDVELVRGWINEVQNGDLPLHVIQPPPGHRTAEAIVRQAQVLDADTLLIDQLSFMETTDVRQPRYLQIREMTHTLKAMISSGRDRMPCLLAHQINREGVKAAEKLDYLSMDHLAEGGETERTADWVFGLYRSDAEVVAGQIKFQTLAARREESRHFQLTWSIDAGFVNVRSEVRLGESTE